MRRLFFGLCLFACVQTYGQTYKVGKNGAIETTKKETGIQLSDSVYTVKDSIVFYKGKKGGIYYLKTSKKTGNPYRVYIKDERSAK